MIFGMTMIQQSYPGIMELSMLLQQRQAKSWIMERSAERTRPGTAEIQSPDRQFAIFIASHYRATITNDASWNSPIVLSMIKGDDRRFAEQSVAEHPAPTKEEIADADAALKPHLPQVRDFQAPSVLHADGDAGNLCLPAGIDRRTAVPRRAGVAHGGRNVRPAGRPAGLPPARVLAGPCGVEPVMVGAVRFIIVYSGKPNPSALNELPFVLSCGLYCGLAILSVALPERGLPDRLAGTWPVPR